MASLRDVRLLYSVGIFLGIYADFSEISFSIYLQQIKCTLKIGIPSHSYFAGHGVSCQKTSLATLNLLTLPTA